MRFKLTAVCLAICFLGRLSAAEDLPVKTNEHVKKAAVMVMQGLPVGKEGPQWMGSGSGSFINSTGLVVTNNHVVDPAHHRPLLEKMQIRQAQNLPVYQVILNGGTTMETVYKAKLKYQNESADLAILQVLDEEGEHLDSPYFLIPFPSEELEDNDELWCYGFPGGDRRATGDKHAPVNVSNGNIRGIQRSPGGRINIIETDVKAAPGNSGGPLVTAEGRLAGVLSQGGWSDKTGDGISVRIIPADLVVDLMKVATGLGKLDADTDLTTFESLPRWKDSMVHRQSLAKRLAVRDPQVTTIANLIEEGDLAAAGKMLDAKMERSTFKRLVKPMQYKIRALYAEWLLRSGRYAEARDAFKKVRNSDREVVAWYGASRYELLSHYEDGTYQEQPLSDPRTFQEAASAMSGQLMVRTRRTLDSYQDRNIDEYKDWKRLVRRLEDHEEELWLANSLDPGPAEHMAYRIWRFLELVHIDGFQMMDAQFTEFNRDLEDHNRKSDRSRDALRRQKGLQKKRAKLEKYRSEIARAYEDLRQKMVREGFRIDDPEAADILN